MFHGNFPAAKRPDNRAVRRRGTRNPVAVGAAFCAAVLLGGCAMPPAAAGPVSPTITTSPTVAPSTAAPAPSTTAPSPSPTKTTPPDPLANLTASLRKQYRACLSKVIQPGSSGTCTKFAQAQLKEAGFYPWKISNFMQVRGVNAVLNYQRSRGLDDDGWLGKATWLALAAKTPAMPEVLPKQCLTKGVVLCVDKSHRKLSWLRDGKVVRTFKIRVAGYNQDVKTKKWRNFHTADGTWKVYDKQVDPYSENYGGGAMPYSTIFYPDMYVHYSAPFKREGYAGSSHGCVNIGEKKDAQWIMKNTPIGAKVYIFTLKAPGTK